MKCIHRDKPKDNHKAGTVGCPIGRKTRIGYGLTKFEAKDV